MWPAVRESREAAERLDRLLRLGNELALCGVRVRVSRVPFSVRWHLRVGGPAVLARKETVWCAGAEGVYAFVTAQGLLLGPADAAGVRHAAEHLARTLGRRTRAVHVPRATDNGCRRLDRVVDTADPARPPSTERPR